MLHPSRQCTCSVMPGASCLCPWCCHSRATTRLLAGSNSDPQIRSNITLLKLFLVVALLCSSSIVAAAPVLSHLNSRQATQPLPSSKPMTQLLTPPRDPDCIIHTGPNCSCIPLAKCKRCSRFEQARMETVCLFTSYKQQVYCPRKNINKFISCHYSSNPNEERKFWIFEVIVLVVAVMSLGVVHYRSAKINREVARRITRQINA